MKTSLIKVIFLIAIASFLNSCERELTSYELVNFERCASENVVVNPFIITDFECQSNFEISDVLVIRNPSQTGINTSGFVGEYTDGSSGTDAMVINFENGLNLTSNTLFNFKVKTTTTGNLRIEFIGGSSGTLVFNRTVLGNQIWTRYDVDLVDFQQENFTQINLIFNEGVQNNGSDVYLVDDFKLDVSIDPCENAVPDLRIVNDFDCQQNYFLGDNPSQTSAPVVDNPIPSPANPSENVGLYTDDGTNGFDHLVIDFGGAIDLSMNSVLRIKVNTAVQGPLKVRLDGGTTAYERTATITAINQWVDYTFNFTDAIGEGNDTIRIFFNADQNNGSPNDIYYIDDIRFVLDGCGEIVEDCTGVTQDLNIITDFDCQENYNLGNDPTINDAPTVQNPNVSCENRSSNVGRYADNGMMPFDNLFINLNGPFDLSTNSTFRMKVLSTELGPILAKLEGGTVPVEVFANIVVTGEWVEYSFDFTQAIGNDNDKLVLFFNAGEADGTIADIYYLDDLRFEAP